MQFGERYGETSDIDWNQCMHASMNSMMHHMWYQKLFYIYKDPWSITILEWPLTIDLVTWHWPFSDHRDAGCSSRWHEPCVGVNWTTLHYTSTLLVVTLLLCFANSTLGCVPNLPNVQAGPTHLGFGNGEKQTKIFISLPSLKCMHLLVTKSRSACMLLILYCLTWSLNSCLVSVGLWVWWSEDGSFFCSSVSLDRSEHSKPKQSLW